MKSLFTDEKPFFEDDEAFLAIAIGIVFSFFSRLGGVTPQGRKKAENNANGNGQKSFIILKKRLIILKKGSSSATCGWSASFEADHPQP